MPTSPQKILIVQTAFIGDVILGTVVIEKLHAYFPESAIDFLVRQGNEGLLQNNPKLRQILVWNKKHKKNQNLFRLIRAIRKNRYDLVINLQRFTSTGLITVLSRAKKTVGFDKNPFSRFFSKRIPHIFQEGTHEVDRNLSLIAELTDGKRIRPAVYPSDADMQKVMPYKETPYICIAPTSVWHTKQFPPHQWIAFLDAIPNTLQVFLLGAPQDKATCEYIQKTTTHSKVHLLAGELSLLQSAALMKDAQMNYVNDSAPMHLSSAMNAPTCAIYCSTVPGFGYGPLADQANVVEIREALACRPCGIHGKAACPEGHFNCAEKITNAELLNILSPDAKA